MRARLQASPHSGSRDHARALLAGVPTQLNGKSVLLDCGGLVVATPSFLDEIVKEVLVIREADLLEILGATPRAVELAKRAADNRGVVDRLRVVATAA